MTQKTEQKDVQLNITGIITATSKKISGDFKSANPRKSAYLELDQVNSERAKDFGLREYTSREPNKETGEIDKFFIVPVAEKLKVYTNGEVKDVISGNADDESNNFNSGGHPVNMAIFKGKKSNNEFMRLYAVNGIIQEIEQENPFADIHDLV